MPLVLFSSCLADVIFASWLGDVVLLEKIISPKASVCYFDALNVCMKNIYMENLIAVERESFYYVVLF